MFTHNIHFKRSDANHSCHQRMLLQLCLVIRPLKFKIKHPPSRTINKKDDCKRSEAKHSRHQRMLLQLCPVIRPLSVKHPPPKQ